LDDAASAIGKSIIIHRISVLGIFQEEVLVTQKIAPGGSSDDAASAICKKVSFYIGFL
jgi:hypothetical protein